MRDIPLWVPAAIFSAMLIVLSTKALTKPEAPVGPSCTIAYPRGVKPERTTKNHPICTNGDLGSTWRACTLQFNA